MPTNTLPNASCLEFQSAIKKRYGKDVEITGKFDNDDKGNLNWTTLDFKTSKGVYSLTEKLKNNKTDKVYLLRPNGQEHSFNRYLDAEVAMIDFIAEE